MKASVEKRARGSVKLLTLPAITIDQFVKKIK
jgi:uncharacterized protein with GYD domain